MPGEGYGIIPALKGVCERKKLKDRFHPAHNNMPEGGLVSLNCP